MNVLQQKQIELTGLPVNSPQYRTLQAELAIFHQKVAQVLEEKFYPENYRSLCAILYSIPHGDPKSVFEQWLTELGLLGCLKWATVEYYKQDYDNPVIDSRWVNG